MSKEKLKLSKKMLENASQEELYQIARTLSQLKEAQQTNKLSYYMDRMHKGQDLFHKNHFRWRFLSGGNRIGKSTAGMVEFIWLNTGTHPFQQCPVPIKSAIVVQDFENHAKGIIEPKLMQWCPPGAIKSIERHQGGAIKRVFWTCGSVTDVYSHDQDLKVFEGSDYDLVWFDEPPPKKIHDAMWRGCTDRGGKMYISGTPIVQPWLFPIYKDSLEATEGMFWSIRVPTWWNAKNIGDGDEELGKKRIEEFAALLDPEERASRIDGEFLQLQGLVFKTWSRKQHLIQPFEWVGRWPVLCSVDPHPRKPWGVTWVGWAENGAKILLRSAKIEGQIEDVAAEIPFHESQIVMEGRSTLRVIRTLIDNYASSPIMTKASPDQLARHVSIREHFERALGRRVEVAKKGPHSVMHKIELFKGWLSVRERGGRERPDFFVFDIPENYAFIDEIESYIWDTYRGISRKGFKDAPVKSNDDLLDPVMQIALTLENSEPLAHKEPRSIISAYWGANSFGRQ